MIDILRTVEQTHFTVRWTTYRPSTLSAVSQSIVNKAAAALGQDVHVSHDRTGGTLGNAHETTFTAPKALGLDLDKVAETLFTTGGHLVRDVVGVSAESAGEVSRTMVEVVERQTAEAAGRTLADRIADVAPDTLRRIEQAVEHDERRRILNSLS